MTEDDHVLIHMRYFGSHRFYLKNCGLSWPPPERMVFDGSKLREATEDDDQSQVFLQLRMSSITDEQIAKMPGIARGAEYRYEDAAANDG